MGLDAQSLRHALEFQLLLVAGLLTDVLKCPLQNPGQLAALQHRLAVVLDDLAQKLPYLLVMTPDDAVNPEIQFLGFAQLEQFAHQPDKAGFGGFTERLGQLGNPSTMGEVQRLISLLGGG
jgi:hypothetical protein